MTSLTEKLEARFELVFNHVTEGIMIADQKGEIIVVNPKCLQLFGYEQDELKGFPVEKLIPDHLSRKHTQHRENYIKSPSKRPMGKNLTLHARKKDGSEFPVEISLSYYHAEEGLYVIAFIIDITERYEHEEKINKVNQELKLLNETLEKKVNERTLVLKEALHDLEQSRDELEKALEKEKELNEMKSRFITMASHEFRTPLSTILSSVALISKYIEKEEQDKREKHISRIKNAVTGLREILNDFLSHGKLEEGKVLADMQLMDAGEVAGEVVAEMQMIAKPGQTIILHNERDSIIKSDPHLLKNVLINLLANAIKFSGENAPIEVTLKKEPSGLQISVRDHGIGIPPGDRRHLFERFFRAKNAVNIQGTGLGLNIVQKYLELVEATIRYESELGKGTVFYLFFPQTMNNP
ncbi:MAG: PAS domain-containing sensor histidine kinase [Crocinitomicaceae bacterium]|nr:PAS domain-containing sensor histidine kinase [Crocinitomicaceae bacterium]